MTTHYYSFFELLNRKDVNGDKFWRRSVLNNIGLVYENLEDFDTALEYYYKSIESNEDIAGEQESYWVYINISLCLAYKYELEEARNLVTKVLSNCGVNCSDGVLESAFSNLGIISFLEQNYQEAEKSFLNKFFHRGIACLSNVIRAGSR